MYRHDFQDIPYAFGWAYVLSYNLANIAYHELDAVEERIKNHINVSRSEHKDSSDSYIMWGLKNIRNLTIKPYNNIKEWEFLLWEDTVVG